MQLGLFEGIHVKGCAKRTIEERKEKAHASERQPAITTVPAAPGLPPPKTLAGRTLEILCREQEAVTGSDSALPIFTGEKMN